MNIWEKVMRKLRKTTICHVEVLFYSVVWGAALELEFLSVVAHIEASVW